MGLPSKHTMVAPTSRPPTRKFHIIQPVVENQKKRSPGPRSQCEAERLEVLEDDPAVGLDDRLRGPGGARRVQDPQRVVEREGDRVELGRLGRELVPPERTREAWSFPWDRDHRAQPAPQRVGERARLVGEAEVLPAIAVAVGDDEDRRVDLPEPVDHAGDPELRGAGGPHRADAGGTEKGRNCDRAIGEHRRHPVAGTDAEASEAGRDRAGGRPQLAVGQLARPSALVLGQHREVTARMVEDHPRRS